MDTSHATSRALFLELMSLELDLDAFEDPYAEDGYALEIRGLQSLSPAHADRIRQRVLDNKHGLLKILLTSRFLSDTRALVEEGR